MRTSNESCTIFEFLMSKLDQLENSFSELINFTSEDPNTNTQHYDQLSHSFKARGGGSTQERDFISELKFSLEDITNYPKTTFKILHHLIGELNFQETKEITAKITELTVYIKKAHDRIINYIEKNEIPESFTQEMAYYIEQLKNLMRDAQILGVETSTSTNEDFSSDLSTKLKKGEHFTPTTAETILQNITREVDQMIVRMPFIVPKEERSRLIVEQLKKQLEKLE